MNENEKFNPKETENNKPQDLDEHEEKKINRRQFLKDLGLAAAGVGIAAAGGAKLLEVASRYDEEFRKEGKEHESQGEAVVLKKEHTPWSNQVFQIGKAPVVIPHFEEWTIVFKIGDKETELLVTQIEYDKYNIGDKVQVKYDDRDMTVQKIANP